MKIWKTNENLTFGEIDFTCWAWRTGKHLEMLRWDGEMLSQEGYGSKRTIRQRMKEQMGVLKDAEKIRLFRGCRSCSPEK